MAQRFVGLFHLGGNVVDGLVQFFHHAFNLARCTDHTVALGLFRLLLSKAGFFRGAGGLVSLLSCFFGLFPGLQHQIVLLFYHGAQGLGQFAHVVTTVHVQRGILFATGHVQHIAGDFPHRSADPQADHHGKEQLHRQ